MLQYLSPITHTHTQIHSNQWILDPFVSPIHITMDLILNLLLKIRLKIVTYLLIMVMRETGKESVYCFFFFSLFPCFLWSFKCCFPIMGLFSQPWWIFAICYYFLLGLLLRGEWWSIWQCTCFNLADLVGKKILDIPGWYIGLILPFILSLDFCDLRIPQSSSYIIHWVGKLFF